MSFEAIVERVEPIASKGDLRLTVAPLGSPLPPRVRLSMKAEGAPAGIVSRARRRLRSRLAQPPCMALLGTHDFARDAGFAELGAVRRSLGKIEIVQGAVPRGVDSVRDRLGRRIRTQLP